MAFDEGSATRVRDALADAPDLSERKMFGGLCFMSQGHMVCGVGNGDDLMLRVGPDQHAELLLQPHARPMDFTGRPMKGFVFVATEGYAEDEDLEFWVERALAYATSLPPK